MKKLISAITGVAMTLFLGARKVLRAIFLGRGWWGGGRVSTPEGFIALCYQVICTHRLPNPDPWLCGPLALWQLPQAFSEAGASPQHPWPCWKQRPGFLLLSEIHPCPYYHCITAHPSPRLKGLFQVEGGGKECSSPHSGNHLSSGPSPLHLSLLPSRSLFIFILFIYFCFQGWEKQLCLETTSQSGVSSIPSSSLFPLFWLSIAAWQTTP